MWNDFFNFSKCNKMQVNFSFLKQIDNPHKKHKKSIFHTTLNRYMANSQNYVGAKAQIQSEKGRHSKPPSFHQNFEHFIQFICVCLCMRVCIKNV